MRIGYIGLGRMGKNMVLRLLEKGIEVVAWNRSPEPLYEVAKSKAVITSTISELVHKLNPPRVIWLMLPAGKVTDEFVNQLTPLISKGDLLIDGGNSFYKDTLERGKKLSEKGIHFMDVGVSGGIKGARNGACLMVGGEKRDFNRITKLFEAASSKNAFQIVGALGAGHFTKMVHNGIEYGMMGAFAEGMAAIDKYEPKLSLKTKEIAQVYANGSIVEGKLATLLQKVVNRSDFGTASGTVPKGETEEEMKELEHLSEMPVLAAARKMRVLSRKKETYEGKILALLRNEFGGHSLNKK